MGIHADPIIAAVTSRHVTTVACCMVSKLNWIAAMDLPGSDGGRQYR
jgi:hypothetical protein